MKTALAGRRSWADRARRTTGALAALRKKALMILVWPSIVMFSGSLKKISLV